MKPFTSNILFLIIASVLVIGIGSFIYIGSTNEKDATDYQEQQAAPQTQTSTTTQETVKTFTLADVATHNNKESCWSAVNKNVYDLTAWIGNHPGGEKAILSICGKDGSKAFNNKHRGAEKPEQALKSFFIGTLK